MIFHPLLLDYLEYPQLLAIINSINIYSSFSSSSLTSSKKPVHSLTHLFKSPKLFSFTSKKTKDTTGTDTVTKKERKGRLRLRQRDKEKETEI